MVTSKLARERRALWIASVVAFLVYMAAMLGGAFLLGEDPSLTAQYTRGAIAGVALVGMVLGPPLALTRREGVEREMLRRATSVAFFALVVATGVYGMLELVLDLPAPPTITVYVFGMMAWLVASGVVHLRAQR
jgi:hypothetical protein